MSAPVPKQPNLDSVTTINPDGSHFFLHPADVKGRWTLARRIFGLALIAVYVALPWIPINGSPALFFDVEMRRFHVFGLTLVPQDLWVMFFGVTGLGFTLFFVTALLGRLWCGWACPYTVFLDHVFRRIERWIEGDSVVIGYDEKRGEPRGKKKTGRPSEAFPTSIALATEVAKGGDCIDCRRCANVCPTGIDIRNGLQLECIGCAACIDACDDIMTKIERPKGLVRYDSLNGLTGKKRRILRPRVIAYTILGLLGLTAFSIAGWKRAKPFTADFSRMRGQPFYADGSAVRNHYQVRFYNKRNQPARFSIRLENAPEGFTLSGADTMVEVPPLGDVTRPAIVVVPTGVYRGTTNLQIEVRSEPGDVTIRHEMRFLGPDPYTPQP